eukprot:CAMPEP_0201718360 /NCGR_PEP_ID=MMETSP0593-20130828/3881_1 /ASSEMBLY_ACC=CAM_ASM_000672 /TAXON_ID=267983 /ORGANISM="Skeletonema japonicum, Strain CCMP2506" /LENGTH=617 /DNA_ID=CAMNT_0048208639 /DNA_START=184 /DNA_END=2033 /DNA_ORIENTATION=+
MATVPKSEEISPSFASNDNTKPPPSLASKLRQLKDRMWVRETLEDLTAAEFASSLTVEDRTTSSSTGENQSNRKRAVDFENVLNKLDARIEEMCVVTSEEISEQMNQTCHVIERRMPGSEGNTTIQNMCYTLAENIGMGSVVYNTDQREALLKRLIATRGRLISFIEGSEMNGIEGGGDGEGMGAIDDIRSQLSEDYSSTIGQQPDSSNGASKSTFDPSLYVRDDGTIDWDGALQDREALKKFGSAVWSRINGQDPENKAMEGEDLMSPGDEFHTESKVVTAKIEDTDAIRKKREQLEREKLELERLEIEHTKLLNSAISAGQAVANVNLATINPSLRLKIRASSDELDAKAGEVTFHTLNYEVERIYTYLDAELGNTATKGYIPLQDRLNVAEFGLLESQVESFNGQMEIGESLDSDVLAVVADQVTDFKRRLGIDYYVTGLTFDSEAIQVWLKDIGEKTKKGFVFYVKGTRLFGDDIVFCLSLIGRALQGYTLKPREVRTLRRTIKDTITFIPVVIILLIPLSPIGHVLVFGAIQRVFPDFFPSCFTERRQNLLELYESTEYSAVTIDETWSQQLIRISQAIGFSTAQMVAQILAAIGITEDPKDDAKIDKDPQT